MFSTFFELYKWYQIAQHTTYYYLSKFKMKYYDFGFKFSVIQ